MAEQTQRSIAITVKLTMNGFPIELSFDGTVDQLPAITKRLAELGAEAPAAAAPASPATNDQRPTTKAEKVQPSYNADGDACCPVHRRKLQDGAHGLFCSAKAKAGQVADKNGYCGLRFEE